MRRIYILFLIIFCATTLQAQPFGNEWINYSQKYYKIPITKEGIYRISRTTLENSGVLINSIDPRSFQIFYRGQEQYIYFSGNNPYIFYPLDYLEFYAKGNDGWLDSALFEPITDITNPYYSMYTDTAYYFLTYNNSFTNKRATLETEINFNDYSSQLANHCIVDVLYQNPQYFYNAENGQIGRAHV